MGQYYLVYHDGTHQLTFESCHITVLYIIDQYAFCARN
jgi:hypothetical protein